MNNHTRMYTNYSKITIPKKYNDNNKTAFFFAHPGFIITTVYRQMFHTRV